MIKVVCNSSPIIGLCSISKGNLLWEILDEAYITKNCIEELYKVIQATR